MLCDNACMIEVEDIVKYEAEYHSRAFKRALQLDSDTKEDIRKGRKITYIAIDNKIGSHSTYIETGDDLILIAQGAAYNAYFALAYDRKIDEKTGEEIRVINPVGKAIADGIISDMQSQPIPSV